MHPGVCASFFVKILVPVTVYSSQTTGSLLQNKNRTMFRSKTSARSDRASLTGNRDGWKDILECIHMKCTVMIWKS